MYSVYILLSKKDGKLYVGCTRDFYKRLRRHQLGYVMATNHRLPVTMIYSEDFESKAGAFQRERFLKSLWGAREKKKIKKEYLETM